MTPKFDGKRVSSYSGFQASRFPDEAIDLRIVRGSVGQLMTGLVRHPPPPHLISPGCAGGHVKE